MFQCYYFITITLKSNNILNFKFIYFYLLTISNLLFIMLFTIIG